MARTPNGKIDTDDVAAQIDAIKVEMTTLSALMQDHAGDDQSPIGPVVAAFMHDLQEGAAARQSAQK